MAAMKKVQLTGHLNIGDLVKTEQRDGYELRKIVSHVAYAVSGNFHNPTVSYRWQRWEGGRLTDAAYRRKDLIYVTESDNNMSLATSNPIKM